MDQATIQSLPWWVIALLVALWVFLKEVLPRINRKGSRTSTPPPPPPPHPVLASPGESERLARELHLERSSIFSAIERFDETMSKIFQSNQQQISLLKQIAEGLEQDRRQTQVMLEIQHELRSLVRAVTSTQETLLRRLEDTGRHPPARP